MSRRLFLQATTAMGLATIHLVAAVSAGDPIAPRIPIQRAIHPQMIRSQSTDAEQTKPRTFSHPATAKRRSAAQQTADQKNSQPQAGDRNGTLITPVSATSASAELPSDAPRRLTFENIEVTPIDLATALSLVDVQNPEYLLAQQYVVEAVALRQLAAVQLLPTINAGTSYDGHTGTLEQSNGNVLKVKRNSLYVGAGASAVGGGTVNIPGVVWNLNASAAYYNYLGSQQLIIQREYASTAARNDLGLQVSQAYLDLLEAEAARSIALKVREETFEVAKITAAYAKTGQGRSADAERAAAELSGREADILEREGAAFRSSAKLAKFLSFETPMRLHATDNWVVPHPIVPDPIPLTELLAIAILQRPELQAQQAAINRALLALDAAKLLPFSPNLFAGFSAGTFGGGSNLISEPVGSNPFALNQSRFGSFGGRTDFDVAVYWTLRNLGVGNRALTGAARSRLRSADLQQVIAFDQVRSQVTKAHVRVHARFAEIATAEQAVLAATDSWVEDLARIKNQEGLPIEVLNSIRLLALSRAEYLRAIIEYNRAQFDLYVALGQPPANVLVRTSGIDTPAVPDEK
jgi:outer membrane protein TolC